MSTACSDLLKAFPELLTLAKGDQSTTISDVCPSENGKKGSIVFVSKEKHFALALQAGVAALVIPAQFKDKALPFIKDQVLLLSPNVPLAMALVINKFFNPPYPETDSLIHPTAVIHSTAKIGSNVYIGPYCVIGKNTSVDDNCALHAHTVIEHNVSIGQNSVLLPHVYVGHGTKIGNFCEIKPHSTIASEGYGFAHDEKGRHHRIPQRGIVRIEDHVSIGAQCTIDRATFEETVIGQGTKLDNMVHIAHNTKVGQHCLFAGGSVVAGSAKIGNNVVVGGQSAIGGHLEIADGVQLAGRSAVPSSITEAGVYGGHPVEPLKDHLRTQATLRKLTPLTKAVKKIAKQLNISLD